MLLKHPTLSRDAELLEKVQNLALEFVKGLQLVPREAVPQQGRIFSRTNRWIRDERISILMITHGLLEFPMEPFVTYPTHVRLRNYVYKFHQQKVYTHRHQHAFTQCIVSETLQDNSGQQLAVPVRWSAHIAHLLPQPIPSLHMTQLRNSYPHDSFQIYPAIIIVLTAHWVNISDII